MRLPKHRDDRECSDTRKKRAPPSPAGLQAGGGRQASGSRPTGPGELIGIWAANRAINAGANPPFCANLPFWWARLGPAAAKHKPPLPQRRPSGAGRMPQRSTTHPLTSPPAAFQLEDIPNRKAPPSPAKGRYVTIKPTEGVVALGTAPCPASGFSTMRRPPRTIRWPREHNRHRQTPR